MDVINSGINFLYFTIVAMITTQLIIEVPKIRLGKNKQSLEDYFKHVYIMGQTGTGKTTFILNMVHEYMKYGTVIFISYKDQKTADELLDTFSKEERDNVVYINPNEKNYKIGFNIFGKDRSAIKNELYVNNMIDTYKTLWGSSIGASSEDIFRMVGLGVAEMEIRTPLEIYKCLIEEYGDYRLKIADKTKNPVVKNFFLFEMPKKLKNYNAINPPRNKQRRIVGSPVLLNTLCQDSPTFHLEDEINSGKVIIANFNQEQLGAENASFIASLFFSQIQIVGFTREDKSMPVFIIADEFQDYSNSSFPTFLSQARSFNMSLTLAHQYTTQVSENIHDAIEGNVASKYYFRIGKQDGKSIKPFLDENIDIEELINLKNYYYLRDIISNSKKQPMKIIKAPSPPKKYNNRKYIIRNSLEKYGVWEGYIDKSIKRRLGINEIEGDSNSNKGGIKF